MLNNKGLCLRAAAQYVLLFLVTVNNSDRVQIYRVNTLTLAARSYVFLFHIYWRCDPMHDVHLLFRL